MRRFTLPEQALAARLGWQNTEGYSADEYSVNPLHPEDGMISISAEFKLPNGEPSAFVWTREDLPPYTWPRSKTKGLTGGPLYEPFVVLASSKATPKPRRIKRHAETDHADANDGRTSKRRRL